MPSGLPEFIPVTGMKCSYGKISSPLTEFSVGKTEISGTEPNDLTPSVDIPSMDILFSFFFPFVKIEIISLNRNEL